jgi:hypothetical protein
MNSVWFWKSSPLRRILFVDVCDKNEPLLSKGRLSNERRSGCSLRNV